MCKWYPLEELQEEYEYKKRFVEEDLTDLMQALDDKVLQCLYYMSMGHEVVGIDFLTSSGVYRKEIGVGGDSLSAIVIDVIRGSGV